MPFPILDLPTEIRLQILSHVLSHSTPIITSSASNLAPPSPTPLGLSPSILCTSSQLHVEGLPILYGANTFQAHPQLLTQSIFALDPTRRITAARCIGFIKRWHVRVRLDCDPYYTTDTVAEAFSGCEELEVEVFRASWGIGGYGALEGFRGVRDVRRAKVHGSVGRRFARWLEVAMESGERGVVEGWEEDEGWVGRYEDR